MKKEYEQTNNKEGLIENKEYYPYVTRSLIRLFNAGRLTNVRDVTVEPNYGHVSRIEYKNGTFRVTYGNDLGLNPGTAEELAKDKGHTKFMLRSIGVKHPEGDEFLLPWWANSIRKSQEERGNNSIKTVADAPAYIKNNLEYPVYVKPVNGSKGADVFRIEDDEELQDAFSIYEEKKVRVAVVERAIQMPDYRIVILDGQLISAYRRIPLAVNGNGLDNIQVLIDKLQEQYFQGGRDTRLNPHDPRIINHLKKINLTLDYIPDINQKLTLVSISNLSAGGTSQDVTETISQQWINLSTYIAKNFNLRLCGVDLACQDITSAASDYSVLEVNASPGLDHYASSGEEQRKIVDDLYVKVLNVPQSE